jgi:starch phosphorylase
LKQFIASSRSGFSNLTASEVAERRRDGAAWTQKSILNVARVAWFSSDRTIAEYASDIWHVPLQQPG